MGLLSYMMDRNRRGEVHTRFHYDDNGDRIIIERFQDVEPIFKNNNEMKLVDDGYTQDRSMRRVARIPNVIYEKILKGDPGKNNGWDMLAAENGERLLQLLDDPDYAKFRTAEGRVAHVPRRHYFKGSSGKMESRPVRPMVIVKPVTDVPDD